MLYTNRTDKTFPTHDNWKEEARTHCHILLQLVLLVFSIGSQTYDYCLLSYTLNSSGEGNNYDLKINHIYMFQNIRCLTLWNKYNCAWLFPKEISTVSNCLSNLSYVVPYCKHKQQHTALTSTWLKFHKWPNRKLSRLLLSI